MLEIVGIIGVIAVIAWAMRSKKASEGEGASPTNPVETKYPQTSSNGPHTPRAIFERTFYNYSQTDRSDALRMCQKRMDMNHDEALDLLIRKPDLFPEMLEFAQMEEETRRRD